LARLHPRLGGCNVAVLVVLLGSSQVMPAPGTSDPARLHARVYAVGGVDRATVERSQGVARRLLASAGIELVWRFCDTPQTCGPHTRPPGEIAVVLSAEKLAYRNEQCGRALAGSRAGEGYVWVSKPCLAGAVGRFLSSRVWPEHPELQRDAHDDVLGAVAAHELGHLLGLEHGRGVMQARFDANDIVALRFGELVFSPSEGARMRALLAERTGEELAGRPKP
jgi:hypothetical protein